MSSPKMFHLKISQNDTQGAKLAIIPGDPERVKKIAEQTEKFEFLSSSREFTIYRAYLKNTPILICSTGIGGPSTSIAVEELAQLGIRSFLRIGTTGAIQPHIAAGDLIISQASLRLDGASYHFAPAYFPAVANFALTSKLVEAAAHKHYTHHIGITASSDTFYPGQERYDTFSGHVAKSLRGSLEEWQKLGILNYEMETATLFTMAACLQLKAACVAGVIVNRNQQEIPDETLVKQTEERAIEVVLAAALKEIEDE